MDEKFTNLGTPRTIWAVGATQGDAMRLAMLHDHLVERIRPGDCIVYTGHYANLTEGCAALDEMLLFRRMMMMRPGMEACDFIYLRGQPEESWQRLLRLQFARDPARELEHLLDFGADFYLTAYGATIEEAQAVVRGGIPAMTRWTNHLRTRMRQFEGHDQISCVMRRAAYTSRSTPKGVVKNVLLVPCGFNPAKRLEEQGDSLWSGMTSFARIVDPCQGYTRIVRGMDPNGLGFDLRDVTLTLDPMEGKGPIFCARIEESGTTHEVLTVDPLPRAHPDECLVPPLQDKIHRVSYDEELHAAI